METPIKPVHRNRSSVVSLIAGIVSPLPLLCTIFALFMISDFFFGGGFGDVGNILILAVIPLTASIIAITAGIVALVQIKKSGGAGKGSAITGIILGALTVLIPALIFLAQM